MEPGWLAISVIRAAGMPLIDTGNAPWTIGLGPGAGVIQILLSLILAAGAPPINTVGAQGGMIGMPAGAWGAAAGVACGTGHMILSPNLAAGFPLISVTTSVASVQRETRQSINLNH